MNDTRALRTLTPVALVFLLLLAALYLFFNRMIDRRHHPNRGLTTHGTGQQVVLHKSSDGHFRAPGRINGQSVDFLIDTGASVVSVSQQTANALGLTRGARIRVSTAGGIRRAYRTRIKRITLGAITVTHVRGAIVPRMPTGDALLGMSFLSHVRMKINGDQMILQ